MAALSLVTMDSLAVPFAQAGIMRSLHVSGVTVVWAMIANCLAWAVLLPTGCALRSRYGDRTVFVAGQLVLAAACVSTAAAPDAAWLIAGRIGQGTAAALIVPTALAHLADSCSPRVRGMLPVITGGAAELSAVLGALTCAGVVESLGWRWVFWLNLPVCIASLGLALTLRWADFAPRRRLDPVAAAVFAAGTSSLIWALMNGDLRGWTSSPILLCFACGTALLAVHATGSMPLGGFRVRQLTGFRVGYACGCAALFGGLWVLPARFASGDGDPLGVWARMAPCYVGLLACAPLSGLLAHHIGPRRLATAALGTAALGTGLLSIAVGDGAAYPELFLPLALTGGGIALALPAARSLAISSPRVANPGQELASSAPLRLFAGAVGLATVSAAAGPHGFEPPAVGGNARLAASLLAMAALCAAGCAAALTGSWRAR